MKKKILSVLLAAIMVFATFGVVTDSAAQEVQATTSVSWSSWDPAWGWSHGSSWHPSWGWGPTSTTWVPTWTDWSGSSWRGNWCGSPWCWDHSGGSCSVWCWEPVSNWGRWETSRASWCGSSWCGSHGAWCGRSWCWGGPRW